MASWNGDYNPAFLCRLIDEARVVDQQGRVSFKGPEFDRIISLLPPMANLDDTIPETEKYSLLYKAVFKVAASTPARPQKFLELISRMEAQYLAKPVASYSVLTDISITKKFAVHRYKVKDATLQIGGKPPRAVIDSRLQVLPRAQKSLLAPNPTAYATALVRITARSPAEAQEHAIDVIDMWRAICNLGLNRHVKNRKTIGGKRKPVNGIVRGPVTTVHNALGTVIGDIWWYDPTYQGSIEPLDETAKLSIMETFWKTASKLLAKSPYSDIMEAALLGYTRALDTRDYNDSFLRLWVELERLTDTSKSGYKLTQKRVSFLFDDDQLVTHLLTHLRDYRNRVVHLGADSAEIEALIFQLRNRN